MSQPQSYVLRGFYTSDGVSESIQLPGRPDYMVVRDRTRWGDASANNVQFEWFRGMADHAWQGYTQAVGTSILSATGAATTGFQFIDFSNPPTYAALATTGITAANPAVCAMASTANINQNDVVRIYSSTGMHQISSYDFTVGTVAVNTSIQLAYLNAAGFAAPATAGWVKKIVQGKNYPRWRYITGITAANPCVCTVSVAHDFTVGERVSFRVPSAYGMTQMNNVSATITAVTASTITLGSLDSSAFTAFAFPTSAIASNGVSPAVVLPSASGIVGGVTPFVTLTDAFDNRNDFEMFLGSSVCGVVSSVMEWTAIKGDLYNMA